MHWPASILQLQKMRELKRNAGLSRTELLCLQQQKFRRLLRHVYAKSAYYRQLIDDLRLDIKHCSPEDFPVLTKAELMANFDRILTVPSISKTKLQAFLQQSSDPAQLYQGRYKVIHTSGSSGEVGIFVYSPQDWARGIMQSNRLRGLPRPWRPSKIAFYGAIDGHYAGATFLTTAQEGLNRWLYRTLAVDINSPLSEAVAQLNQFQPDLLYGYTTGIGILAQQQSTGRLKIAPSRIELGGECVTQADKQRLAQAFGAEVFNVYACSEHIVMGSSRQGESNLQLWEDDLMFEVAADQVRITNLFNWTLPLIRYRMNDLLLEDQAARPEPYRQIQGLVGRAEQTPWFINDQGELDFISPHVINEIFVPGVRGFQLQQLSQQKFRFKYCLEPGLEAAAIDLAAIGLRQRLQQILATKMMNQVQFELELISELPVDPLTRKFRLVVNV